MMIDAVIVLTDMSLPPMRENQKEFARAYVLGAWASNMTNVGLLQISKKDYEFVRASARSSVLMLPAEFRDQAADIAEDVVKRFLNMASGSETDQG